MLQGEGELAELSTKERPGRDSLIHMGEVTCEETNNSLLGTPSQKRGPEGFISLFSENRGPEGLD